MMKILNVLKIIFCAMLISFLVSNNSWAKQQVCTQQFCLKQLTSLKDTGQFNKAGLFHNHLIYQMALTKDLSSPAALNQAKLIFSKDAPMSLLHTSCTEQSCIYTLQNNNIADKSNDLFKTVTLHVKVPMPNNAKQVTLSNDVQLTLPRLQSCHYVNNRHQQIKGVRLNSGALPVYEGGKALTKQEYTASAMNQLYPVPMNGYHMTDHLIAITDSEQPFLFSSAANNGIPNASGMRSPKGAPLNQTTCAAAAQQYNLQLKTGHFVTPFSSGGIVQQCYDDKQIRFVHYAVPDGTPPSKNGWPVVIMFHGYTDQSVGGYYLTTADAETKQVLPGTPFENTFLNGWDWTKWELDGGLTYDYESYDYYARMRLEQSWLSRGYAVIVPSTWNAGAFDSWSYEPSYSQPWFYNTDPSKTPYIWPKQFVNSTITYLNKGYWPGFDKQFLVTLMSHIMSNQFDPNNPNSKMDSNNLFIMGYSAGANMVSRLMNEFPSMTLSDTAKTPFPKIRAAIILSGGSYACYADGHNICPENALEERYNSTADIVNHPPTLLAQSLWDTNAGTHATTLASTSYYNSYLHFCPKGASCQPVSGGTDALTAPYVPQNLIQIVHTNNDRIIHSYFPEMVIPSLNLLLAHTCVAVGN